MDDLLLTVAQIAEQTRVEPETVRRWLRRGLLHGALLSRKGGWRVRASDLEAFLQAHMNQQANQPTLHAERTAATFGQPTDNGDPMTLQQALNSSPQGAATADLHDALGNHCRVLRKANGTYELTTRAAGLSTLFDVAEFATLADLLAARPYLSSQNWQPSQ